MLSAKVSLHLLPRLTRLPKCGAQAAVCAHRRYAAILHLLPLLRWHGVLRCVPQGMAMAPSGSVPPNCSKAPETTLWPLSLPVVYSCFTLLRICPVGCWLQPIPNVCAFLPR
eukprot:1345034-Amphidinium_carterae.1